MERMKKLEETMTTGHDSGEKVNNEYVISNFRFDQIE